MVSLSLFLSKIKKSERKKTITIGKQGKYRIFTMLNVPYNVYIFIK